MHNFILKNNINASYKLNKNTPRVGLAFNFSIANPEKLPGIYCLMARLFLQGTKKRSSEALSKELDENAIEFFCDMKQDYLRFRFVCLNEDFEHACEILADVIKNSTFEEFNKEKNKMLGEITAELDSARVKALDNYYKNIFKDHYYGNTYTKMIKSLPKITKDDVVNAYNDILINSKKVISFVGDFDFDVVKNIFELNFGDIAKSIEISKNFEKPVLNDNKTVKIIKNDAQQAQIFKGWIVPTFDSPDYATLIVLNIILGAAGLSSRLFLELREKKGLAYTVRSSYETNQLCANFSIYIGTEPKNIQTSIEGFDAEIQKLKDVKISEKELESAKNNILGKQQFVTETNSQQANLSAYYAVTNRDFNFQEKLIEMIKLVTAEQIQECAKKYFTDKFVISIIKP